MLEATIGAASMVLNEVTVSLKRGIVDVYLGER